MRRNAFYSLSSSSERNCLSEAGIIDHGKQFATLRDHLPKLVKKKGILVDLSANLLGSAPFVRKKPFTMSEYASFPDVRRLAYL